MTRPVLRPENSTALVWFAHPGRLMVALAAILAAPLPTS
jgi:hypothetical protein